MGICLLTCFFLLPSCHFLGANIGHVIGSMKQIGVNWDPTFGLKIRKVETQRTGICLGNGAEDWTQITDPLKLFINSPWG